MTTWTSPISSSDPHAPGGDDPIAAVGDRLGQVRAGIAAAAADAGVSVSGLTLVVVTKFHPASLVRELHRLGVTAVGESRHQEASAKHSALVDLDLAWHFVGQVQTKKARQIAAYSTVIHSVDRPSLVSAFVGPSDPFGSGATRDVFLQVNLTADQARGGVDPAEIESTAELILTNPSLVLLGVMAVAPLGEEPRRAFARLRGYGELVRRIHPDATSMSAGMSNDYREAILEGATHLRIGSAITGIRPPPG